MGPQGGKAHGNALDVCVLCFEVACLAFSLALAPGCGGGVKEGLSAQQVLARSVEALLALKSYHDDGTSSLTVAGGPNLNNKAVFDTWLAVNPQGALDGHMVVKSPSYSYETYTSNGNQYTRIKGGEWTRVDKTGQPGSGMVSAGARRIIAQFADLAEDVRFTGETGRTYTVSLTMGRKYYEGAAAISGAGVANEADDKDTRMTLTVDKKTMRIVKVTMNDAKAATGKTPAVKIVTVGSYSGFDQPVDIEPPPEARAACQVSESEAPPTLQPQ